MLDGIQIPGVQGGFSKDQCFLCGKHMGKERTYEHVFAKWLLHRLDLWDEQVTLSNNTHIPYRKLGIPCCARCNQQHLSPFENRVKTASAAGRPGLLSLDEMTLFLWIGKMMYGLVHKELLLNRHMQDRLSGSIVTSRELGYYSVLHGFLQLARIKGNAWEGAPPCSVFVYNVSPLPERNMRFWFRDSPAALCFAICMRDVGVVAALLDGGATKWFMDELYTDIGGQALTPVQFEEIAAQTFYVRSLQRNPPRYRTLQPNPEEPTVMVVQEPTNKLVLGPTHRAWIPREYGYVLGHFLERWGVNPNRVVQPDGSVFTTLFDSDGRLDLSRKKAHETFSPEDFAHVMLSGPSDEPGSRIALG